MVQTRVIEKIQTRVSRSKKYFPQNVAVYQIIWKNIVDPKRPQMTVWGMRIACWIPKSKNTHSEYVLLIDFLLQEFLPDRASVLRYTYVVSCYVIRMLFPVTLYVCCFLLPPILMKEAMWFYKTFIQKSTIIIIFLYLKCIYFIL
jgi:hypothetical protein